MSNKKIAESIVQKLGQEGVAYLKATGELPAVKLTNKEMSFLKAGATGHDVGRGSVRPIEDILTNALGGPIDDKFIAKKRTNFSSLIGAGILQKLGSEGLARERA